MVDLEVLDRDGLGRRARFSTPHGTIETPALLPVVHPDPARQPVPPSEMRERLGVRAVITSSYITWRTPPLRATATERGIHGLLAFNGPIMTDSGAFQQHAYGSVEVGPEEILDFQGAIGSDIATVLDLFTEPDVDFAGAESALTTTMERARAARARRDGLLAVPVQGGAHPSLRARAAEQASALADVLAAARPRLAPGAALHLFGTGHPMTFAFAALWGVDLFDSSAYHKFARRGSLLFPEGTIAIDDLREEICRCFLCAEVPLTEVARLPLAERERRIAFHNLATSVEEIGRVRQAIRDGTLWELAERRAVAHPALRAGLEAARRHSEVFLPTEPASRRAFREIGSESRERPAVARFRQRVGEYVRDLALPQRIRRVPLRPEYLGRIPTQDSSGTPLAWSCDTPLGFYPLELTELYPVGPYLGIAEFESRAEHRAPTAVSEELAALPGLEIDRDRDWTAEWTDRQVQGLLRWEYGPLVVRNCRRQPKGSARGAPADFGPWSRTAGRRSSSARTGSRARRSSAEGSSRRC